MIRCYRCLGVSVALLVMTTAGLRAQSQSATPPAQAVAPGTLPLANIAPEARSAIEAAIDANQAWLFFTAFEQAGKALAIDSTLGIARSLQAVLRGGPTAAAEHRRALADAAGRPVPELSLILATRAGGANRATLLTAVKTMLPNDRRIALDYAS